MLGFEAKELRLWNRNSGSADLSILGKSVLDFLFGVLTIPEI